MLEKMPETASLNTIHPFDRATQVTAVDGGWRGQASADYFAFVGPFGGVTAATMLRAIRFSPSASAILIGHSELLRAGRSGVFDLAVRLLKATRSTQHWMVELIQNGEVATLMTAVFAARRPSWSHQSATMPDAPPFDQVAPLATSVVAPWAQQYQFRFVEGAPNYSDTLNDTPASAYSRMWLSDTLPRPVDCLSLLSMSDSFFARIFHVLGAIVPIGTVSMTTVFHADSADLVAESTTMVLGAADANSFHKSFSDQTGELWSPNGRVLATTSQVVYFKA